MRFALFAADWVGKEVAAFFREAGRELACLVLHPANPRGFNDEIAAVAPVPPDRVFSAEAIQRDDALESLRVLDVDLGLLAWWPAIIKRPLISIPKKGFLNFHPSYLPHNRGKHYNFWTLVEESPFGVSLHWVDDGVDSGAIAFQSRIEKTWEDTGETLFYKAQREIVRLFRERFVEIERGRIPRIPQPLTEGSFHRASEIEEASRIELDQSYRARDLLNLLRARSFPPFPGAWFSDGGERYEVRVEIRRVEGP